MRVRDTGSSVSAHSYTCTGAPRRASKAAVSSPAADPPTIAMGCFGSLAGASDCACGFSPANEFTICCERAMFEILSFQRDGLRTTGPHAADETLTRRERRESSCRSPTLTSQDGEYTLAMNVHQRIEAAGN